MPLLRWQQCCACEVIEDYPDQDHVVAFDYDGEYDGGFGRLEESFEVPDESAGQGVRRPWLYIKEHFDKLKLSDNRIDVDGLATLWVICAREGRSQMADEDLTEQETLLVRGAAEEYINYMDMKCDGRASYFSVVAFMLGALVPRPGLPMLKQAIRDRMQQDPDVVLDSIVGEFLALEADDYGYISVDHFAARHMGSSRDEARAAFERIDTDCDGKIDLSDYIAHSLKDWQRPVELLIYDVSESVGSRVLNAAVGHGNEAIYHTSILVHGCEFWFGPFVKKSTSPPGFGKPLTSFQEALKPSDYLSGVRSLHLGYTFDDPEQVLFAVSRFATYAFRKGNYNVFSNNCNHFAHELALHLTGRGIPKLIREQTETFIRSPFIRMLVPALQLWLGEQGSHQIEMPPMPQKAVDSFGSKTPKASDKGSNGASALADEREFNKWDLAVQLPAVSMASPEQSRGHIVGFSEGNVGFTEFGIVMSMRSTSLDLRCFRPRTCTFFLKRCVSANAVHSWYADPSEIASLAI
jgi:hypothetical protein